MEKITAESTEEKKEYVVELMDDFKGFEPELQEVVFEKVLVEQKARLEAERELKEFDAKRQGNEYTPPDPPKVASKAVKSDGRCS